MISRRSLVVGAPAVLAAGTALAVPRSPLVFPTGVRPGFNSTHIAAPSNGLGTFCSTIASGGSFINVVNGAKATVVAGVPASAVDSSLGPVGVFNASWNVTLAYPTPTAPKLGVTAAIFTPTAATQVTGQGFGLGNSAVQIQFFGNAGTLAAAVTVPQAMNVPWFAAASMNAAISFAMVAVNLVTGQIYTTSGTTTGIIGATITFRIGGRTGSTAAAKVAAAYQGFGYYLSLSELVAWAKRPWDFWYPPSFNLIPKLS